MIYYIVAGRSRKLIKIIIIAISSRQRRAYTQLILKIEINYPYSSILYRMYDAACRPKLEYKIAA